MPRFNVLKIPLLRKALISRWPLLIVRAALLAGFVFAILAGLLGTPVGNHNFAIVAVWIAWWAALMLVIVPFLGRGWCAVCPIPMPGEWLQHKAVLGPSSPNLGRKESSAGLVSSPSANFPVPCVTSGCKTRPLRCLHCSLLLS